MNTSKARCSHDNAAEDYSAKKEIDQFMSRFLGFVKEDNSRAAKKAHALGDVGSLSAENLNAALRKLDSVYEKLDNERFKSIQMGIQIEAIGAVRRSTFLPDVMTNLMSANITLKRRCQSLQGQLMLMSLIQPIKTVSDLKTRRMMAARRRSQRKRVSKPSVSR